MARFPHLSLLLLVLAVLDVSAAPAQVEKRSFKIERRRTGNIRHRNGVSEMARAYRKYGWTVPEGVVNATIHIASNQEGETEATAQEGDAEFLSPIKVGGQELMMNFDTGSADLWVFSTSLPSSRTAGHTVFDPSKSKTFQPMEGSTFNISYGDQSGASGTVGLDKVSVGEATVPNQAVELADTVTDSFVEDVNSDGLMGLGFMTGNTVQPQQQNTFFGNIADSLKAPLFTVALKHATAGSYQFGEVDTSQFTGTIVPMPVDTSQGYWQFASEKFVVGDGDVQTNPNATPAIADTGTTLLLVDDAVLQGYYSKVKGAGYDKGVGGITFPCDTKLPDLKLVLGPDYMAKIPGPLINYQAVGGGSCYGGLQSSQGQPIQILGDILFKSQFVVFDNRGPSIGFAPHADT